MLWLETGQDLSILALLDQLNICVIRQSQTLYTYQVVTKIMFRKTSENKPRKQPVFTKKKKEL